jgi:signal transduction histidine kinase
LHQGLAVARWASLGWMVGVVALGSDRLRHPVVAWTAVAVTFVATALLTWALRARPALLQAPEVVGGQLLLGAALLVLDGVVFEEGHAFATSQNLAASWPLVAVLAGGVAWGPWLGIVAGALVGAARLGGALANGVRSFDGSQFASLAATVVFYALAGGVAGWIGRLLRRVETEVLTRRARDEVARTLHDTVLQTLALVERRTAATDPELAALALEADRELRTWMVTGRTDAQEEGDGQQVADLRAALELAVRAALRGSTLAGEVNVVDVGAPAPAQRVVDRLAGAVREAATNAVKHAAATRLVVFAEVDDDGAVFVSVADDGRGFDAGAVAPGHGITGSIEGRVRELGGRVELVSRHGGGTEVRMWVP